MSQTKPKTETVRMGRREFEMTTEQGVTTVKEDGAVLFSFSAEHPLLPLEAVGRPKDMSYRSFAGYLSALKRAGMYIGHEGENDAFGLVMLEAPESK